MIELEKVSFSYKPDKKVLKDISLKLKENVFWAIVGPNGAGKSTLLDVIAGYKVPESGCVKIKGIELKRYSKKELAKLISFVPQEQIINFPFRVEEVVLMGRYPYMSKFLPPSSEDLKATEEAIRLLGLTHLKDRYITQLSGGEKQRVFFARALCQNTPILLLDEAISEMDIKHKLFVLEVLKREVKEKGKTVMSVMHDINLAMLYCDGLVFMKDGRIVKYGKKEEVLNESTLKDVFELECHIYREESFETEQILFKPPRTS